MRFIGAFLAFVLFNLILNFSVWSSAAMAIWIGYLINLVNNVNNSIAFREYILMMYGLNYLFSPALTYEVTQEIAIYKMKLTPETYFSLAIPAMFCLHAGLYTIKTKIFTPTFNLDSVQRFLNESLLKQWLIAGVILYFIRPFFPGDLAFIVYLLSGIRYLAAFGLFILDKKKYKWYLLGILFIEVSRSLAEGMFHDMTVWLLFFGLMWAYLKKPSQSRKLVLGVIIFFCFFILQSTKESYREQLQSGEGGGFSSFSSAVSKKSGGEEGLFNFQNFANSITRANQGWIFASSVNKMNFKQNYQDLELVKKYAEAAILPRFIAPDKLEAGDKGVFNQFSGAFIAAYSSTSMGLGLFADGYISYGAYGTFIFAFLFGLICALVFKTIERWSRISPIFILFFFPLLNYAVRADCESQTWMGHIVKGLLTFGVVMYFTKHWFRKKTMSFNTPVSEKEELSPSPHLISNTI
jgi:hypothetical protein